MCFNKQLVLHFLLLRFFFSPHFEGKMLLSLPLLSRYNLCATPLLLNYVGWSSWNDVDLT